MMKIYTPQAWLSIFGGSPSLVIDDKGYIYSADGYYKIFSDSPVGKIDFEKGYIYDKHYTDIIATPIAIMERKNDALEVREYGKPFSNPILYIKNDKIYTPEEYFRILGGAASGYIQHQGNTTTSSSGSSYKPTSGTSNSSGGGGCGLSGILIIPMFALVMGLFYILSDEGRLANATSVIALVVVVIAGIAALVRLAMGKVHFEWNGKRFLICLGIGFGVYFFATALFVLLGLGSNIGTGRSLSDAGGDQMELSALLIGLPFVLEGFLAPGPKKSTPTYTPPKQTYTPPKQTYTPPKQTYTPPQQTYTPPQQTYTPPKQTYTPPQQTYIPGKEMVRRVMVQEFGEQAVFPDALIGRNTAEKADLLLRLNGHASAVFFILPDTATTYQYNAVQNIGQLWASRGAVYFIVYERDCRDPNYIRQWLHTAVQNTKRN